MGLPPWPSQGQSSLPWVSTWTGQEVRKHLPLPTFLESGLCPAGQLKEVQIHTDHKLVRRPLPSLEQLILPLQSNPIICRRGLPPSSQGMQAFELGSF